MTTMYYAALDKVDAVKDWFRWHLRDKREQKRSTTSAYEEEHIGIVGGIVAVVSVVAGVAACVGLFVLAVVAAA